MDSSPSPSHEYVKKLLEEEKADPNQKNKDGCTALMAAAMRGQKDMVQTLLEYGADATLADNNGHTALVNAIFGNQEQTALLLAQKCNKATLMAADKNGESALLDAARFGMFELIKLLAKKGADIEQKNHKGESALSLAMLHKRERVVQFLMEEMGPVAAMKAAAAAAIVNASAEDPQERDEDANEEGRAGGADQEGRAGGVVAASARRNE